MKSGSMAALAVKWCVSGPKILHFIKFHLWTCILNNENQIKVAILRNELDWTIFSYEVSMSAS